MQRILMAADESACADEAVTQAASLLGTSELIVLVLSVIPPASPRDSLVGDRANRAAEDAQSALDRAVDHLAARGHRVEGTIRVGEPARTIVEAAREFAADLIVVGTHQRQGEALTRCGSVAAGVLASAPCGVLVFPLRKTLAAC